MKANELRLHNILMHGEEIVSVSCIFRSHFKCENNLGISYNSIQENLLPIPLTEEWLMKFGFDKREESYELIFGKLDLEIALIDFVENWSIYLSGSFGMVNTKRIQDVHQLQNLYFVLTGEELTTS